MQNLTRLQACKKIRKETLLTVVQGQQLISYQLMHEFGVRLMLDHKKKLIAVFQSSHSVRYYPVKVTWKQALNFLRKYYSRRSNEKNL